MVSWALVLLLAFATRAARSQSATTLCGSYDGDCGGCLGHYEGPSIVHWTSMDCSFCTATGQCTTNILSTCSGGIWASSSRESACLRCSSTECPSPPPAPPADDSCRYANDGECDEPQYCSTGTDCSDCQTCGHPPPPPPVRSWHSRRRATATKVCTFIHGMTTVKDPLLILY